MRLFLGGLLGLSSSPLTASDLCITAKSVDAPHKIYGQLVMTGFTGQTAKDPGVTEAAADLREGYAGGLLFFNRNITSPAQLKALSRHLKQGVEFPPLLAIDEEGGRVQRLTHKQGFSHQPSAAEVSATGREAARKTYGELAGEVAGAGLNFNLGPVVDLNLRPGNPIIGRLGRSYGRDAGTVAGYARVFVEEHRARGVITALKHFPGHGSSRQDSHEAVVDVTADWKPEELIPYRTLIEAKMADAIMLGHITNRSNWSSQNLPATFSPDAVAILRSDFRYDGVIVTDDLQMDAVAREHLLADAIVRSLDAGNDIVIIGNVLNQQPQPARFAVKIISDAVKAGDLNQEQLERSFCRIVELKKRLLTTAE
jgi:beta-N-acetylhexosaminidase